MQFAMTKQNSVIVIQPQGKANFGIGSSSPGKEKAPGYADGKNENTRACFNAESFSGTRTSIK